jgi:hypothetical protein
VRSQRGFVEAADDTFHSFSDVAPNHADCHAIVRKAISEACEPDGVRAELESMLIHFAYARKLKPEEGPALHSAATAKDTVANLCRNRFAAEVSVAHVDDPRALWSNRRVSS